MDHSDTETAPLLLEREDVLAGFGAALSRAPAAKAASC